MMVHPPLSGEDDKHNNNNFNALLHDNFASLDNLDNIVDDLMSFGSSSSHSPRQQAMLMPSSLDEADDENDDLGDHFHRQHHHHHEMDASSYPPATDESWRLSNAVHMEVQENAKLPTFNWPVDRSGSAILLRQQQRPRGDSGSGILLAPSGSSLLSGLASDSWNSTTQSANSSYDPSHFSAPVQSLAELFLKSPHRTSFHANYEQAGVLGQQQQLEASLRPDPTTENDRHENTHHGDHREDQHVGEESEDLLDVLAAEVEPTPIAEIQRRHEQAMKKREQQSHHRRPPPSSSETSKPLAVPAAAAPSSQPGWSDSGNDSHPYYRVHALPVPTQKVSPPHSPTLRKAAPAENIHGHEEAYRQHSPRASTTAAHSLAEAVATAAQIAAQTSSPIQTYLRNHDRNLAGSRSLPSPTGTRQAASGASAPDSMSPRAQPTHAAKHRVSSGSIQRASQQQTQYGFGSNHVVPSIPAPPVALASKNAAVTPANRRMSNSAKRMVLIKETEDLETERADSTSPPLSHQSGAAYERKKQRAKDARVKLNESIERLSVAISLAGTQSKQRASQWSALATSPSPPSGPAGGRWAISTCQQIMQDCVKTAESAKKWDRPSFVGTAATLVQGLNAQCEALMRELITLQEKAITPSNGVKSVNMIDPGVSEDGEPVAGKRQASPESNEGDVSNSANKKPRVEPLGQGDEGIASSFEETIEDGVVRPLHADGSIFGERRILERIARYLDPTALLRCRRVSKVWKESGVFTDETIWQELALFRFGSFHLRQWQGRFDDEDHRVSPLALNIYRSMDLANVLPQYTHDGLFLLGEARMPGRVSAWTFLVERSNGETLRSVRRKNWIAGLGVYTSLPVVELRTVVQNTGIHDEPVIIRKQTQTVDASTRRRGEEMMEIDWDDRFKKRILNLDGSPYTRPIQLRQSAAIDVAEEVCRLRLYESVVIDTYIHAQGCSTTSKFIQRSNFTKVLVQIRNGTTVPLVVPFPRDSAHLHHQ